MQKILVANRGEIALRIMRSAKEMGLKTVAIYSEADNNALHVNYADEAVCIGPSPSSESYLKYDKIIQVCSDFNVDAIHPGYGFLSENAVFARLSQEKGINFIGPSPEAITIMGSKLKAKSAVTKYDIPLIPGTNDPISDINEARVLAQKIGFPILIKASAGGGGKGMRIVKNSKEFKEQMNLAISEAISSFGDGAVFIEKYIASPRHIEIQILADKRGNVVHLFERECSIQRRHQKVIEEAPSSILNKELRKQMGVAAVNVAKSCNYEGAGTVEFLLDEKMNFYFLEMNTRLQVEHPVTEMITGLDLVKEQIKIAQGKALSFKQEDLIINGHSIQTRIYAEDPANDFLPDIGKLLVYKRPNGIGVRLDDAYDEGMNIPIYYDPMIAKLITHGKDRNEAIQRMKRALNEYIIGGVKTTIDFGKFVMNSKSFCSGNFNTHFVKDNFKKELLDTSNVKEEKIAAVFAANFFTKNKNYQQESYISSRSKWKENRLNT